MTDKNETKAEREARIKAERAAALNAVSGNTQSSQVGATENLGAPTQGSGWSNLPNAIPDEAYKNGSYSFPASFHKLLKDLAAQESKDLGARVSASHYLYKLAIAQLIAMGKI